MVGAVAQKLTVSEYLEREDFEEGYLYELINGDIVKKQAPSPQHQHTVVKMLVQLETFAAKRQSGQRLCAPVDVFLDQWNVYQPDILFVAKDRLEILTPDGVQGAPDLIIEVLSPSSIRNDRTDKMKACRRHGVREYWIADPKGRTVEVYSLINEDYEMVDVATETGQVRSILLAGLVIDIENIFA